MVQSKLKVNFEFYCNSVVGDLALQQPGAVLDVLDAWIDDDDMWLRRTAILHQLNYGKKTDVPRLLRWCAMARQLWSFHGVCFEKTSIFSSATLLI